jgi:hypothetical protein
MGVLQHEGCRTQQPHYAAARSPELEIGLVEPETASPILEFFNDESWLFFRPPTPGRDDIRSA